MRYEVRISGKTHMVELERHGNAWQARLDGQATPVDAVEIAPHTISVLLPGQSHEISLTSEPNGKLLLRASRFEFSAEVVEEGNGAPTRAENQWPIERGGMTVLAASGSLPAASITCWAR